MSINQPASIIHARYNMRITLYEQTQERNPDTGQTVRTWSYFEDDELDFENGLEIDAIVRGVVSEGIRTVGATERWSEQYEAINWIRIFMPPETPMTARHRVGNIKSAKGDSLWLDEQDDPIIFNVYGVQEIVDPFGREVEKFALAERVDFRSDG